MRHYLTFNENIDKLPTNYSQQQQQKISEITLGGAWGPRPMLRLRGFPHTYLKGLASCIAWRDLPHDLLKVLTPCFLRGIHAMFCSMDSPHASFDGITPCFSWGTICMLCLRDFPMFRMPDLPCVLFEGLSLFFSRDSPHALLEEFGGISGWWYA